MSEFKKDRLYHNIKRERGKYSAYLDTPLGMMEFLADDEYLISIMFVTEKTTSENPNSILKETLKQFRSYFDGTLKKFDLPIQFNGTDFQNRVWKELCNIPYGETISYKELAVRIGNERACRAVGGANGKNIVNIVAPCHRVIGSNSSLTGYGGGLDKKEWLLQHEKENRK